MTDTEANPRTYPAHVHALIDNWNARVGGLDTLRILADALEECGEDKLALACRDAVVWFEESGYFKEGDAYGWFDSDYGISRMSQLAWWRFYPLSNWHAIELYADFPPLETKRERKPAVSVNHTGPVNGVYDVTYTFNFGDPP